MKKIEPAIIASMKRLFLTSSVAYVAHDIAKRINKEGLKLAFILTPTEVEEGDLQWLKKDRKALIDVGFKLTDYTFTGKTKDEVKNFLKDFDGIYMSGGNTFWFLEKIQQSKSADVIRDFINSGKLYISTSAGSIIAGPDIYPTYRITKAEKAKNLKGYDGLGLVDFVVFPHWGNELSYFKDNYLNHRLEHAYNKDHKIILLTDNQYIIVEDDWYKIIDVTNV